MAQGNRNEVHGKSYSGTYKSFLKAKSRCCNIRNDYYHIYGGRGIEFRFASFAQWFEELGDRPVGMSVDRIDSNGHYEIGNVRWATQSVQMRNTSRNHFITFRGKTQTITDWASELGIPNQTLSNRIHRGWTIERAMTTPRQQRLTPSQSAQS